MPNNQMPYQPDQTTRCLEHKYEARFTPKNDSTCLWGVTEYAQFFLIFLYYGQFCPVL